MADKEPAITAEQLASWLTPREAHALILKQLLVPTAAANAIWQRLVGGMIGAIATTSSTTVRDYAPTPTLTPIWIPGSYWAHFTETGSNLWDGDVRFFLPAGDYRTASLTVRCFAIKLNPADILATLPAAVVATVQRSPAPPAPAPSGDRAEPESVQAGPPVADEHLRSWYDLYRKVYRAAEDTEANAVASAQGMFQRRSVSRARIRVLRGRQDVGRKPKAKD